MLAVALLALTVAVPSVAAAEESDDAPLSEVPAKYQAVIEVAAQELGVSASELQSASRQELQDLLCSKLDSTPTDELVADVKQALEEAPPAALADTSDAELAQLEAQLPTIIAQIEDQYCDGADEEAGADEAAGGAGTDESDSGIPTPSRIDTGGGGAAAAGGAPFAFGGLFAALFGLFGIGLMGRRRKA